MPKIGSGGGNIVNISDDTTRIFIEPSSQGLTISRAIHKRIDNSNQWLASYVWVAIVAAGSVFFHIKTDANCNPHGIIQISSAAKVTYYIYEDPTLTNDGVALDNVCQNRQTVVAPETACYVDPTITVNGTQLEIGMFGSPGKFTAVGATIDNGGYFLLKKSESYLVRVDNDDAAAQDICVTYMWHEE